MVLDKSFFPSGVVLKSDPILPREINTNGKVVPWKRLIKVIRILKKLGGNFDSQVWQKKLDQVSKNSSLKNDFFLSLGRVGINFRKVKLWIKVVIVDRNSNEGKNV